MCSRRPALSIVIPVVIAVIVAIGIGIAAGIAFAVGIIIPCFRPFLIHSLPIEEIRIDSLDEIVRSFSSQKYPD